MRPQLELTQQQKIFTLLASFLGLLLAALDQTIVSTAGPTIQKTLAMPDSLYAWITTSYLVASTVSIPIFGKASDVYGRKPPLVAGMIIFLTGSLLCGLSGSSGALIASRAVQGIGSAALFTNAFAVIADLFPPSERGKYQGLFGAVFGLSSVVGPLVGGYITDTFGWPWTFFINLPLGIVALAFVFLRMPALGGDHATHKKVDLLGAFTLILAVVPFLVALSMGHREQAPTEAAKSSQLINLALLGLTSLIGTLAFIWVEKRSSDPILDLRLFRQPTFRMGILGTFVMGGVFLASIVFLPLFMTNVVGLSATYTGLTTVPLTMGIVLGNVMSGQWVARIGRAKPILVGSIVLLLLGFSIMGFTLSATSSQLEVTLKMFLVGLGLGPSIPLFTTLIQNSVSPEFIGVSTASASFFRQIGSTLGVTLAGAVFALTLATGMSADKSATFATLNETTRTQWETWRTEQKATDAQILRLSVEAVPLDLKPVFTQLQTARKETMTRAISRVYQVALLIALVGLLVTLRLPEAPMRKTPRGAPPTPVTE